MRYDKPDTAQEITYLLSERAHLMRLVADIDAELKQYPSYAEQIDWFTGKERQQ